MILLFLILNFVLTFFIHRLLLSLKQISSRQLSALISCFLSVLVSTSVFWERAGAFATLAALTTSHFYFHLFNMSETARRIKLLQEIACGNDPLKEYSPGQAWENRFQRLESLGVIARQQGEIVLKKRSWTCVARLFRLYERMLFPERS